MPKTSKPVTTKKPTPAKKTTTKPSKPVISTVTPTKGFVYEELEKAVPETREPQYYQDPATGTLVTLPENFDSMTEAEQEAAIDAALAAIEDADADENTPVLITDPDALIAKIFGNAPMDVQTDDEEPTELERAEEVREAGERADLDDAGVPDELLEHTESDEDVQEAIEAAKLSEELLMNIQLGDDEEEREADPFDTITDVETRLNLNTEEDEIQIDALEDGEGEVEMGEQEFERGGTQHFEGDTKDFERGGTEHFGEESIEHIPVDDGAAWGNEQPIELTPEELAIATQGENALDIADALTEEAAQHTALIEQISGYELDPDKRATMIAFAETLSIDELIVLLDTLKTLVGPTPAIVSLEAGVRDIIDMATRSTLLKHKNREVTERLTEFVKLSQTVSRMLGNSMRDDTINSLRIEPTIEHIKKLNETIAILSTGIYDLASKVGMTRYLEPENMPVNIDNLLKVLCIIGHGAKSWAVAAEFGKATALRNQQTIEILNETTKAANQRAEDMRVQRDREAAAATAGLLKSARYYHIMNYSGIYVGTRKEADEDGQLMLTRKTVIFTHDQDLAVPLTTMEDARALYDALHSWHDDFKDFRQKMKQENVRIDTLFIGETTVRKVEA